MKSSSKDNKALFSIGILSVSILAFLVWLIYGHEAAGANPDHWSSALPTFNAFFNFLTCSLLIFGLRAIRRGEKSKHIGSMLAATLSSAFFLVGYIVYHTYQGDTSFLGRGFIRSIYFAILISHIVLSMVQVPLILTTLYMAFSKNWEKHKKFARWTFPIWLYVSVTGILVYLFLYKL